MKNLQYPRLLSRLLSRACLIIVLVAVVFSLPMGDRAIAGSSDPLAEQIAIATPHSFEVLWKRVQQAVRDNDMGIVGQASVSRGAASRGITIPGNAVVGVYRNDFAVRMLKAHVPAGIEAPLRLYITEDAEGTATLRYRPPSAVFKAYENTALDEMARELDIIFDKIVRQATGRS